MDLNQSQIPAIIQYGNSYTARIIQIADMRGISTSQRGVLLGLRGFKRGAGLLSFPQIMNYRITISKEIMIPFKKLPLPVCEQSSLIKHSQPFMSPHGDYLQFYYTARLSNKHLSDSTVTTIFPLNIIIYLSLSLFVV